MSKNISGNMSGYAEAYGTMEKNTTKEKKTLPEEKIKEIKEDIQDYVDRALVLSKILYDIETRKEVSDFIVTLSEASNVLKKN